MSSPPIDGLTELGVEPGLCATCRHHRLLRSPRSVFLRCGLADHDPMFPRYPRLPVLRCRGFDEAPSALPARRDAGD